MLGVRGPRKPGVKVRAGLLANERAAELAKNAAVSSRRKPDYGLCPVKRFLRKKPIEEWAERYASGSTAYVTKLYFSDAAAAYNLVRNIKLTGRVTQLMMGHGGFSYCIDSSARRARHVSATLSQKRRRTSHHRVPFTRV